jgi:hypothetical protein
MSKSGITSLVGEDVVVRVRDARTEEITGTILAVTSNGYKIAMDSRGSTYTYMIPFTVPVYAKNEIGTKSKFDKGDTITAEIGINRVIKIKGKLESADENGFILAYVSRNKNTRDHFAYGAVERIQCAELTKEGRAASKERSERMREARGGKKSKGDKKLKLVVNKKHKKAA